MSRTEIYVSVDVEADGPIPGPYSMLSLGAVAVASDGIGGVLRYDFSVNFERLPDAGQDPATMRFWSEHPEAYEAARVDQYDPATAMGLFLDWLGSLPGKPVFVGYPASYDYMFVHWYFVRFLGRDPFGIAALDMKTLAWALLGGNFRDVSKRRMPGHWFDGAPPHDHRALTDAAGQAALFSSMLGMLAATRRTAHEELRVDGMRRDQDARDALVAERMGPHSREGYACPCKGCFDHRRERERGMRTGAP